MSDQTPTDRPLLNKTMIDLRDARRHLYDGNPVAAWVSLDEGLNNLEDWLDHTVEGWDD